MADSKKTGAEIVRGGSAALTTAAGSAAGAVAAGATAPQAFLVALFGAAAVAMQLGIEGALGRKQAAGRRFVARIGKELGAGSTVEEARGKLEARLEQDPNAQDSIFETVRELLDAATPEVAEPLGALAAEYFDKPIDAFFRGFARTLRDVSATEFVSFRQLVERAHRAQQGTHRPNIQLIYINLPPSQAPELAFVRFEEGEPQVRVSLGPLDDSLRLFHLLKVHGLGFDTPTGGLVGAGGPQVLNIARDSIEHIARLLG